MGTRGYTAQAEAVFRARATLVAAEAVSGTALGQLLRKGQAGLPHDKVVPVKAFQRDLVRKVALRKVMGKPKKGDPAKQREVLAKDKDSLLPGTQFTKENVNYRYSGDRDKSCGACVHFQAPSACEIVAGLINRVDLCDKFEPLHKARQFGADGPSGVVKSELIPNENTLGEAARPRLRVQAEGIYDDEPDDEGSDCDDEERDMDGNCPGDPGYDSSTAGLYDPELAAEREGGPGSGPQPRGKGAGFFGGPHGGTQKDRISGLPTKQRRQATHALRRQGGGGGGKFGLLLQQSEVTPPGFEPVVKALKRKGKVKNPWAVAWAMKDRGVHPKPAKSAEDEIPVGRVVRLRQGGEGMSQMGEGGHEPISDVPSSPSGRYEYPSTRKPAGVLS